MWGFHLLICLLQEARSQFGHRIEDANLLQDLTIGHAITDILHSFNSTHANWFCKLQEIVETATYLSRALNFWLLDWELKM